MKRVCALTVAILLGLTLSGCGSGGGADGWRQPELPDALPVFTAASVLPFDQYQLGRAEREQLQLATAEMLGDCVEGYGLAATFAGDFIQQISEDPSLPIVFQWGGRLGTLSEEQASEYGYSTPQGSPWQNGTGIYLSSPANLFPVPSEDPVDVAKVAGALYGADRAVIPGENGGTKLPDAQMPRDSAGDVPPEGGCERTVEEAIDVSFVELSDIELDVYGLTFDDDRVKQVISRWVSCMSDAGYDYERVDDAANANAGIVTPESIAVAVADVRCTAESRWPDTFYYVLADYQKQAIDKQPDLFQSALAAEQERLDVVNRLVG